MFQRTARVAILLSLVASSLFAADVSIPPTDKKPWEWSLEERLTVRLDPAKIAERQLKAEADVHALGQQTKQAMRERADNYGIDGRQHPELLLPHELLESLLTGFMPDRDGQARWRKYLRPAIKSAGFDELLFWARLNSATSEYVAYKYRDSETSTDRGPDFRCRSAFDALSAARQEFGQERFDRFLYQGVAPLTQVASATTESDPAAELRRVATGCR